MARHHLWAGSLSLLGLVTATFPAVAQEPPTIAAAESVPMAAPALNPSLGPSEV